MLPRSLARMNCNNLIKRDLAPGRNVTVCKPNISQIMPCLVPVHSEPIIVSVRLSSSPMQSLLSKATFQTIKNSQKRKFKLTWDISFLDSRLYVDFAWVCEGVLLPKKST